MAQGGNDKSKIAVQVSNDPSLDLRKSRVDFDPESFDDVIKQKGYFLKIERNFFCPCRRKRNGSPIKNCVTCGGDGYFYPSFEEVRGMMTSITKDDRVLVDFSALEAGLAYLTLPHSSRVGYMDKVTVRDAESIYMENIFPKDRGLGTDLEAALRYAPLPDNMTIYQFIDPQTAVNELSEGTDYTFSGNRVTFSESIRADLNEELGYFTARYTHHPVFHVMNVTHDNRNTRKFDSTTENLFEMPIQCIIKRAHLVDNPSDS